MKFLIGLILFLVSFNSQAATYQRQQLIFGNVLGEITLETSLDKNTAFQRIQQAFTEIHDIDATLSTYSKDSELSLLRAYNQPLKNILVSPTLKDVLQQGVYFTVQTDGYFDVAYESVGTSVSDLVINGSRLSTKTPINLYNPTGLVKGYTIDRLLVLFKKMPSVDAVTIKLGGDIGFYSRQDKAIQVYLQSPQKTKSFKHQIVLSNQSVSTAGQYERGRHIKNSRRSSVEHQQVSVVSSLAMVSDALSTAMLFMPVNDIKKLLKRFPGTQAIVVDKDGMILEI